MTRARSFARRGFTLLELFVGLAVGAVIASAGIAAFVQVRYAAAEAATRSQMARDAQVALDAIERDLTFFGAGVPLGTSPDTGGEPYDGQSMLPVLRVARSDNLVFLGDQPYPNSELAGIVGLAWITGGNEDKIAVSSEVSGSCVPPGSSSTAATDCSTAASTWIKFPTAPSDCDDGVSTIDSSSTAADFESVRSCPWGLNKWLLGSGDLIYLTVVDSSGNWYIRRDDQIGEEDVGPYFGNHLEHWPSPHKLPPANFFGGAGGGSYITTMDRVFYSVEESSALGTACDGSADGNCTLRRRQCWGYLENPADSAFPAGGTSSFVHAGTATLLNCASAAPADGTAAEVVISGFDDLRFRYYQNATTQLTGGGAGQPLTAAQQAQVRAIEVEIRLRRQIRGSQPARFLIDVVKRRYVLPNQE